MAILNVGRAERLLCALLPWLAALCLGGCGDQLASPQQLFARVFAKEAEFDGTYLIVRLPRSKVSEADNALTLKIPKTYLTDTMAHRKWPGVIEDERGISKVSIDFSMPDITEWVPPGNEVAKKMGQEEWERYRARRVLVYLHRDGGVRSEYGGVDLVYADHLRDGMFVGLERYTRTVCYKGATLEDPKVQEILKGKQADDASPENCVRWRRRPILIAPPELWAAGRGVVLQCGEGTCDADIAIGGHRAEVVIPYEQLSDWEPRIQAAQALVSSFIVKK